MNKLQRFITAQETYYPRPLTEIKKGRKLTHWIWFIFPQIAGLGYSETSKYYAIKDINEANLYIAHPVLGSRLIEISNALLELKDKTANQVFGSPDDLKLRSCMTLFGTLQNANLVFQAVFDKYFNGDKNFKTLSLLNKYS